MALNSSSIGSAVRASLRFLGVLRQPAVRTPARTRTAAAARTLSATRGPAAARGRAGNAARLPAGVTGTYPGDFTGTATLRYSPSPDGRPDPGEIVWTWVPFEEDYSRGKDRPVLLVGSHGRYLLGLMLTSKTMTATRAPASITWTSAPGRGTGKAAPARPGWTASCRFAQPTSGARGRCWSGGSSGWWRTSYVGCTAGNDAGAPCPH